MMATLNMTGHAELLKRLLPPHAYDPNGVLLSAELAAEGSALDAAQASAAQLLREVMPATVSAMLAEWEYEYGLSDVAPDGSALSKEQRLAALRAKTTLGGGQSRGHFIAMAEALGFAPVTITEFAPATCLNHCNDSLYSEEDRAVWRLNVPLAGGHFSATCNSNCNSPLASWGSDVLEQTIRLFKPADTEVIFAYR